MSSTNGAAPAVAVDGTDEAFGDAFTRLADSVVVVPPTRNGALPIETWSEGPARAEIEELDVEKEPVPLEEQDGLDDPVRMYLREIGKVHLLSGADEKRLARQMEEAKHLAAIEQALARTARPPAHRTGDRSSRSSSSTATRRSARSSSARTSASRRR